MLLFLLSAVTLSNSVLHGDRGQLCLAKPAIAIAIGFLRERGVGFVCSTLSSCLLIGWNEHLTTNLQSSPVLKDMHVMLIRELAAVLFVSSS